MIDYKSISNWKTCGRIRFYIEQNDDKITLIIDGRSLPFIYLFRFKRVCNALLESVMKYIRIMISLQTTSTIAVVGIGFFGSKACSFLSKEIYTNTKRKVEKIIIKEK